MQLVIDGRDRAVAVRTIDDGTGRWLIAEQTGLVRVWDGEEILPTPFLDLTGTVVCCGERGLLGLALHPDFTSNGLFFVHFVEPEPEPPAECPAGGDCAQRSAIVRYQVSADPNVADAASATRILTVNQPGVLHNGGNLLFGPDGYLYLALGDGGADQTSPQPLDNLWGKMLRLDVDGPPGGDCGQDAAYAIPPDNPFVGPDACDEIWARGLRNPWRWSFDRLTGDLFIGDVGIGNREEVSFQPASSTGGENYGYPCMEGDLERPPFPCLPGPLTAPILVYPHEPAPGCAVIGGYRYRGKAMSGWYGDYFFADLCDKTIYVARQDRGSWSVVASLDASAILPEAWPIGSFAEDLDGELLVVVRNVGSVYRLVQPGVIFADGFESGDTSRW
jgi:glucose/arabinose dehydrogenase